MLLRRDFAFVNVFSVNLKWAKFCKQTAHPVCWSPLSPKQKGMKFIWHQLDRGISLQVMLSYRCIGLACWDM